MPLPPEYKFMFQSLVSQFWCYFRGRWKCRRWSLLGGAGHPRQILGSVFPAYSLSCFLLSPHHDYEQPPPHVLTTTQRAAFPFPCLPLHCRPEPSETVGQMNLLFLKSFLSCTTVRVVQLTTRTLAEAVAVSPARLTKSQPLRQYATELLI